MHALTVTILFFKGCPNHAPALDAVHRAGTRAGLDVKIVEIEVTSPQEAERLGFLGSPTVRVSDEDVEPAAGVRRDFGLACRRYGDQGVPSDRDIEAALRVAPGQPRHSFVSRIAGVLALFTSTGTLVCCALPASLIRAVSGVSEVVQTCTRPVS